MANTMDIEEYTCLGGEVDIDIFRHYILQQ